MGADKEYSQPTFRNRQFPHLHASIVAACMPPSLLPTHASGVPGLDTSICSNPFLAPRESQCEDPACLAAAPSPPLPALQPLTRACPFQSCSNREPWSSITDPAERKAFLKQLHELKTDIFNELIETGRLPVRPGVKRLIGEAVLLGKLHAVSMHACMWVYTCVCASLFCGNSL